MLLHLLNRSPASSRVPHDALRAMGEGDRLLLIEDGVYGAISPLVDAFQPAQGRLFVLHEDLVSRGLETRCNDQVTVVDMAGFVAMTEEAERTVSWF